MYRVPLFLAGDTRRDCIIVVGEEEASVADAVVRRLINTRRWSLETSNSLPFCFARRSGKATWMDYYNYFDIILYSL